MADLFDYLKWRGDLSFQQDPPNEVDALIFSGLSYIRYGDSVAKHPDAQVSLLEAAEEFFGLEDKENRILLKKDLDLIYQASQSRRFGDVKLYQYQDIRDDAQELQFAAVTFLLDDGSAFIAFRGTDSTLVGWKEDFNMSFMQVVPAQLMAADYVRKIDGELWRQLRLGGHSKGGNLAVFAAARSSPMVQERILQVFNNDGPGFTDYLMGDVGYQAMVPKIRTIVPQSSVIGMLLEHEEPYTVVRSKQIGILQHDYYTWDVLGNHFIPMQEMTADSRFVNVTIKNWVADMDNQQRSELVDAMFGLLNLGEVDSALDIFQPKNLKTYIKTLSADGALRRILSEEFQSLMEAARKTVDQFSDERKLLDEGNRIE